MKEKPPKHQWEEAGDHPWAKKLKEAFPHALLQAKRFAGLLTLWIARDSLREVCTFFRDQGFTYLVDIAGVHYPEDEESLEVVYHLHHMGTQERLRLKVRTKDGEPVPSVTPVWPCANWLEREAFDMVGILFKDHPNLKRILLWEGFQGHPLRKDFPIEGKDTGAAIYPEDPPK